MVCARPVAGRQSIFGSCLEGKFLNDHRAGSWTPAFILLVCANLVPENGSVEPVLSTSSGLVEPLPTRFRAGRILVFGCLDCRELLLFLRIYTKALSIYFDALSSA